jgi:hypothetical protein
MSGFRRTGQSERNTMISAATRKETLVETEGLTYQLALRALGAWLDEQGRAPGIRIVETTAGFIVQQSSPHHTDVETSREMAFDQVWNLADTTKRRKRSRQKDGGYQNLLRAVGYELDEADAHMILLEQIEDDLLLTYLRPQIVGGFALVKHFSVIPADRRIEMLRAAQGRRNPGKLAKGFLRLMGDV